MGPNAWVLDIEDSTASIPGSGDEKLTLTYAHDVARAVVMLRDLTEWTEYGLVAGDDITFNEMVRLTEKARGK